MKPARSLVGPVISSNDGEVNNPSKRLRLLIGGTTPRDERYPHSVNLVEACRQHAGFEVIETGWAGSASGPSLYQISRSSLLQKAAWIIRYGIQCLHTAWTAIGRWRKNEIDALLLPYPAIGELLVLSFLPIKIRPPVVTDLFISVADTVINDRGLVSSRSQRARWIWRLERRAMAAADIVLCDTQKNVRWASSHLGVSADRLRSIPLLIDESIFRPDPYAPSIRPVRVLFVGTFVPLHGAEHIARAIVRLASRPDIEFTIVGDGQSAQHFASIIGEQPSVRWDRGWQSAADIARLIRGADICLGIFGEGDKTARVWPLKNYYAMAVGRAIISSEEFGLPSSVPLSERNFFHGIARADGRSIAEAIVELADAPEQRLELANRALATYWSCLSNACSVQVLSEAVFAAIRRRALVSLNQQSH